MEYKDGVGSTSRPTGPRPKTAPPRGRDITRWMEVVEATAIRAAAEERARIVAMIRRQAEFAGAFSRSAKAQHQAEALRSILEEIEGGERG